MSLECIGWGGGVFKYTLPIIFLEKNPFSRKFLILHGKNDIFWQKFWDQWKYSQIWKEKFPIFLTPLQILFFLYPSRWFLTKLMSEAHQVIELLLPIFIEYKVNRCTFVLFCLKHVLILLFCFKNENDSNLCFWVIILYPDSRSPGLAYD